jgi:hypothetical protein
VSDERTRVEKHADEREDSKRLAEHPAADPGKPRPKSWDEHNPGHGGEGLSKGYGGSAGPGTGPSGPDSQTRKGGERGGRE